MLVMPHFSNNQFLDFFQFIFATPLLTNVFMIPYYQKISERSAISQALPIFHFVFQFYFPLFSQILFLSRCRIKFYQKPGQSPLRCPVIHQWTSYITLENSLKKTRASLAHFCNSIETQNSCRSHTVCYFLSGFF